MALEAIRTLIEGYDDSKQDGHGWLFVYAPRSEANAKLVDHEEVGKILFNVTEYESSRQYRDNGLDSELESEQFRFRAFCGLNSEFTKQYDGAIEPDKQSEGKWATYINPIRNILDNTFAVDICTGYYLLNWSMRDKVNYLDQNYDGVEISFTLKKSYL